ncbi:MAG TPA: hypothetical protein VK943_12245, partial [Arenibaculum sp.]|nr:hypothetical protein [Arenibaculum sp.]
MLPGQGRRDGEDRENEQRQKLSHAPLQHDHGSGTNHAGENQLQGQAQGPASVTAPRSALMVASVTVTTAAAKTSADTDADADRWSGRRR